MKDDLINHWRGQETLLKAFWLNFFLGQFIVFFIAFAYQAPIYLMFGSIHWALKLPAYFANLVFIIWALVGIWRSSKKSTKFWCYLARTFVITYSLLIILGFIQWLQGT